LESLPRKTKTISSSNPRDIQALKLGKKSQNICPTLAKKIPETARIFSKKQKHKRKRMIRKIMKNKNGKLIARLATNTLIFSQGKGPNGWGPKKCACGMNCS